MATWKQEGPARPFDKDEEDSLPTPRSQQMRPLAGQYGGNTGMDWFGPLFSQHFGKQDEAIKGVNSAMSQASRQWSDANQFNASRQHERSMQTDLLNAGIQMKQMDLQKERERSGLLRGLLSSAGVKSGFTIDGKGRYSRH
jgi:hypothetical protein